jgi:hypothetical protein
VARKPKSSGRLSHGPFEFAQIERAIMEDGWKPAGHGDHPNYKHPSKAGKVQLDKKWTGIKKGCTIFRSIAKQAGLSPKEFLRLLNR